MIFPLRGKLLLSPPDTHIHLHPGRSPRSGTVCLLSYRAAKAARMHKVRLLGLPHSRAAPRYYSHDSIYSPCMQAP